MLNSTAVSKEETKISKWQNGKTLHTFIKKIIHYFPKPMDGTPRVILNTVVCTSIYSVLYYISHITDTAKIWYLPWQYIEVGPIKENYYECTTQLNDNFITNV